MQPKRLLFLVFLASPAFAQTVEQGFDPPPVTHASSEFFGSDVCGLDDVDGDGVPDFAVHARRNSYQDPAVRVYSGADRSILVSFDLGPVPDPGGFVRLAGASDMDHDGVGELLVGNPRFVTGSSGPNEHPGQVLVFSLAKGELLRFHDGSGDIELGASVAGGDDWDGDGVDDYLVGAPQGGVAGTGAVYAYSGADGSLLDIQLNPLLQGELGRDLALLGDVSGSADEEVLAGGGGAAIVYTPVAGGVLHSHWNPEASFGDSVCAVGDVTGDDRADYAIAAPLIDLGGGVEFGELRVYSGGTGTVLWSTTGTHVGAMLGEDLALLHDAGVPHVVATTDDTLRVFRGWDGALVDEVDPFAGVTPPLFPVVRLRVGGLGDTDDDDAGEILVGAPAAELDFTFGGIVRTYEGVPSAITGQIGSRNGQSSGAAVAWLGDVNGDGVDDCAVGAPHEDLGAYDAGAVRVLSGADGVELWHQAGITGSQLGAALVALDDLDGDGVRDLAVGEPWVFTGSVFGGGVQRSGAVRVLSGADGSLLHKADGETGGERFGAVLAALGDVDGDGLEDYAAGAPGHRVFLPLYGTVWIGRVSVRSGADGSQIAQLLGSVGERIGVALAGPGDVDGDGTPDLAVAGVDLFAGASVTRIEPLPFGPTLWTKTDGPTAGTVTSLAALGDVDQDGIDDLAVGLPDAWTAGAGAGLVRVRSGVDGSEITVFSGSTPFAQFGASVAGAGDVDIDGTPDVAVGAPGVLVSSGGFLFEAGRVQVFSGTGGDALREWDGTQAGAHLGAALVSGGDVDGDGLDELIVGAPGTNDELGKAWVLNPRAAGTTPFGTGTPNCKGVHRAVASGPAALGTLLRIRGDNGIGSSLSGMWISLGPHESGIEVVGCLIHLSLPLIFFDAIALSDPDGRVTFDVPVPTNPGLVGLTVYAQLSFSNTAQPCPELSSYQLSTSHGLEVVVLP